MGCHNFMSEYYYPDLNEFILLLFFVFILILIGKLIKNILLQKKEFVKFSFILLLWLGVIVSYVLFSGYLYLRADTSHRFTVLAWSLLFWFVPMFYYSLFFVNIVTTRIVEQISPIGDKIDDPSPFANARKLALMGDIDGAIALYRSYKNNQVEALFEVFRLLKSRERHEESLTTLQEIIDQYGDRTEVWIEAKYYQAKIKSAIFKKYDEAIQSYKQILRKRPKTPFHTIASAEIARLQAIYKADLPSMNNEGDNSLIKQEMLQQTENSPIFSKQEKKKYVLAVEDTILGNYVPPDPFFKGDIKKVMGGMGKDSNQSNKDKKEKSRAKSVTNKKTKKVNDVKKQTTRSEIKKREQKKKKV